MKEDDKKRVAAGAGACEFLDEAHGLRYSSNVADYAPSPGKFLCPGARGWVCRGRGGTNNTQVVVPRIISVQGNTISFELWDTVPFALIFLPSS